MKIATCGFNFSEVQLIPISCVILHVFELGFCFLCLKCCIIEEIIKACVIVVYDFHFQPALEKPCMINHHQETTCTRTGK